MRSTKTIEHSKSSRCESGMSLIGLLVGLLISMLCILASLTLYKNLVSVTTGAKVDALHDGQLSAALLMTQKEVMNAGFGIEDADASHVIVNRVAAVPGTSAGSISVIWRYKEGGVFVCKRLLEDEQTINSLNYRVLTLTQATSGCTETAVLNNLSSWSTGSVIGQWPVIGGLATYINTHETLFNIQTSHRQCAPFGAVTPELHVSVQFSAPTSAQLNGVTGIPENVYDYCLSNTYPAS